MLKQTSLPKRRLQVFAGVQAGQGFQNLSFVHKYTCEKNKDFSCHFTFAQ